MLSTKKSLLGFAAMFATVGGWAGCDGPFLVLPFGTITAVQLFDQPSFTIAFSVDDAVSNPASVSRVNWVFGDGSGFEQGQPNRTTITHRYAAIGTYDVEAYIFGPDGQLSSTLRSTISVQPGGTGGGGGGGVDGAPGQISSPSPVNNASNVSVHVMLSWIPHPDAESHDVYLGTDESSVEDATTASGEFRGNQADSAFDSGDLTPDTDYYWRIDESNSLGTTKGTVLKFHTAPAPGKAKSPVPANGSVSARADQVLQWSAGENTSNHDVYFGKDLTAVTDATTETDAIFKGNQASTSFNPEDEDAEVAGELLPATMYFWRIDEIGPGGMTKGDVFSFQTRAAPPQVTNPTPIDGASNVDVDQILGWQASSSIENFDVYFGEDFVDVEAADRDSPEFQGNQTTKLFDPGMLLPSTVYFWRVDTRGPGGTTKGLVFTFETATAPGAASGPFSPSDNEQNVTVDLILSWNVGGGGITDRFEIFFSTDQTAVVNGSASALRGNQDVSQTQLDLTPPNLTPATQYFWRVDSIGPGGRTNGPLLRFRTGALPGQATGPVPLNGAIEVSTAVNLQWTPGVGSVSSDVYLGTDQNAVNSAGEDDAEFQGNVLVSVFAPPTLDANTQYFWRIDARSAGGARKGVLWQFRTGPGKALNPTPQNGQTDAETNATLSWTAGVGASTHDVYFGTNETEVTDADQSNVNVFKGNQAAATFNPGSLIANTQYFWRIDEVAENGDTTKGDVWTFTTQLGKATNPVPANMATGVSADIVLEWTAGAGAATHDVYFGTSLADVTNATTSVGLGVFQGNQASSLFDPAGSLTANTTYFWRIDSVPSVGTTRKGDVWRFTTLAAPAAVTGHVPASGTTGVSLTIALQWAAANNADSYDVYFGTDQNAVTIATTASPEFKGNQTNRVFDPDTDGNSPAPLIGATQYFWRIDSKNAAGTTTGSVVNFTTS